MLKQKLHYLLQCLHGVSAGSTHKAGEANTAGMAARYDKEQWQRNGQAGAIAGVPQMLGGSVFMGNEPGLLACNPCVISTDTGHFCDGANKTS